MSNSLFLALFSNETLRDGVLGGSFNILCIFIQNWYNLLVRYFREQCENVRSGFNYQLHRHILNKTRFISLRSHPKIPISVLGFSTSQNRIAPVALFPKKAFILLPCSLLAPPGVMIDFFCIL
ncbi:MAG: hypothetical protein V7L26_04495 [Nostoc sp.]|uniref:hypothetical protein n=1 Tax=Nostoc sp. TaxID=1180 RepID=UPI002FEFA8A4